MQHFTSLIRIVQFYESRLRSSNLNSSFENICYFLNQFRGEEWKEFFMADSRPLRLYSGKVYHLELAQLCKMYPSMELVRGSRYGMRVLEGGMSVSPSPNLVVRPFHRTREFYTPPGSSTLLSTVGGKDTTALIVHYLLKK